MNDFTKEELEIINGYVQEINRKYETTDEMDDIAKKIQSMIENYCDHDIENPNNNEYMLCSMCGDTFQC